MTTRQNSAFLEKTARVFRLQKRRAGKEWRRRIDYELCEFRCKVFAALGRPCKYCRHTITLNNFSADHAKPVRRGGSFAFANLWIVCDVCNRTKGLMLAVEFFRLREFLATFPGAVRRDILGRLKAGNLRYQFSKWGK